MIDHEKVEQAVRLLLEGIGEDVNREGLIDTPDRIARMYEWLWKKILHFTPHANTTCCHFTEKYISDISRMEKS